mmetsp:Transcript_127041/g.367761  ORF Transcript_127041/g.367761 Transcript_127041/m.367761 type:complete len:208 (+) Transcript_127041:839-1462(+)
MFPFLAAEGLPVHHHAQLRCCVFALAVRATLDRKLREHLHSHLADAALAQRLAQNGERLPAVFANDVARWSLVLVFYLLHALTVLPDRHGIPRRVNHLPIGPEDAPMHEDLGQGLGEPPVALLADLLQHAPVGLQLRPCGELQEGHCPHGRLLLGVWQASRQAPLGRHPLWGDRELGDLAEAHGTHSQVDALVHVPTAEDEGQSDRL